jgi:uncharacterized protein YfaS (alpha-2-macroglobulin family)
MQKIITLFLLLVATGLISINYFTDIITDSKSVSTPFSKNDSYPKLWKKVDSCEAKGLTESALKIIEIIYEKAKTENNAPQFVKSVLFKMKFESYKEEFSLEKSIIKLRDEVQTAKFPIKPVLQSILADSYWQYYQNNRWKFQNRTKTENFKNDDIETWDLNTILENVTYNYIESIKNSSELKNTKIDLFDDIIIKGTIECRKWRPKLYDFLAYRAINHLINTEGRANKAAEQFYYNDKIYLMPYIDFLNHEIPKPIDSLNTNYLILKEIQGLTQFQLKTNNTEGLIDIELTRLDYIYRQSKLTNKDTLYFNTLKALKQKLQTNERVTEIDYRLGNWYLTKSSLYNPLKNDDYKWYKKTARELFENSIKSYPESYGAKLNQNQINLIESKQLNLSIEEVQEPNVPFRALITSQNINKIYFKIVQLSTSELRRLNRKYYGKELFDKLLQYKLVDSFEQSIINDGDYQSHKTEIKMPALPIGTYVILSSLNQDFNYTNNLTSTTNCIVSNLVSIEKRNEDGSYEINVMNRQSGDFIPNATLQLWYENYDYKDREYVIKKGNAFKTNEKGHCHLSYSELGNKSFYIELINGNDSYFQDNSYYTYKSYYEEKTQIQSHIFTDRAIYRPGQTIYFKNILLQSINGKNHSIKPNHPTTITFYDVNYQVIQTLNLTTNEYGTVSGSFTDPMNALNGQMHITDGYGSAYFSVEEYKRPKFETAFHAFKGSYELNDTVSVIGFAKAYAGNMIDGAKVKYRVKRKTNYPYWYWWYYPNTSNQNDIEIENGEISTNDTGCYIIKFIAKPDESISKTSNATFRYEISADVTDINGETHSTQSQIILGYKSLNLSLNCPEIIDIKDKNQLSITTTNLNGEAEAKKGTFQIYKLKGPDKNYRKRLWAQPDRQSLSEEEYKKIFPKDEYADELNKYKWEKDSKVSDKSFDTKEKTKYELTSDIKNLKPGTYLIEASCLDKKNEEVKAFFYTTIIDSESNQIPDFQNDIFLSKQFKAEPGETLEIINNSVHKNTKYLFEIEKENEIIQSAHQSFSSKPISFKVEESHRGNFTIKTCFIKDNRFYSHTQHVDVPYTNKELEFEYETFRDKLNPGQQEEWKLIIKDKKGEKAIAEMLAGMYDSSLDAFTQHYWNFNIHPYDYSHTTWSSNAAKIKNSISQNQLKQNYKRVEGRRYDDLNYFGLSFYRNAYYNYRGSRANGYAELQEVTVEKSSATKKSKDKLDNIADAEPLIDADMKSGGTVTREEYQNMATKNIESVSATTGGTYQADEGDGKQNEQSLNNIKARSNFNETAFFFPQLQTNEKGEIIIKFTIPESLTKWKFMGLAHTKDLKIGYTEKEIITQKELMVQPNAPRFFRENDNMIFIAKISNLSENDLSGIADIKFYDALTEKDITREITSKSTNLVNFQIKKGLSTSVEWDLSIPENYSAIKYKIVSKAGNFSDGEEMVIPVVTNRMLVTESLPMPIRSFQTKDFSFTKFINQNNHSTTLKNHAYTLEFTANPAWYAIQALPYLMEYPYECAEQTFARYYANTLASYVVNSKPKIKATFDAWKNYSVESFYSNLQKNQELKSVILEETPWVLQAKNEQENKKRVALLFDLNKMSNEKEQALKKLFKKQSSNGGFVWFDGGPDDWYITQHIITGFGHLNKLNVISVKDEQNIYSSITNAVKYCDARMKEEFDRMKKYYPKYKSENHLSYMAIQYLYMRSFFKEIGLNQSSKEHYDYYLNQCKTYWLDNSRYMQGMIALVLNRHNDSKTAKDILKSLKENSINSEEMGMYWKENYGYYWYEAPIEMQALMIEAYDEINNDEKTVDDLKTWLIKSKQTQHWGTTRSTTDAVYAMLLKGSDWLSTEPNVEITIGNTVLKPGKDKDLSVEPGTGYFKKTWNDTEIKPESMGNIKIKKQDAGVSYGAVYWQYFEQLDKITPHETPLKLKKQLFLTKNTAKGEVIEPINEKTNLKPGDKIKVRIELRVDRDMDYVHMKDMRASGLEPTNVISTYKYQDGLGYYESTRDLATHFFISRLNKGTYVFEYPLLVSHYGNFSNGITTIQCMYAPEFTSHSEGIRLNIKK